MKIGDLVKDRITELLGIIVDVVWDDSEDEAYAVIQLPDNSKVLCSYEDMELIACNL